MDDQKAAKEIEVVTKKTAVSLCKQCIEQAKKFPKQTLDKDYALYFNAKGHIDRFAAEKGLKSESPPLGNDRHEIVKAVLRYCHEILDELDE